MALEREPMFRPPETLTINIVSFDAVIYKILNDVGQIIAPK